MIRQNFTKLNGKLSGIPNLKFSDRNFTSRRTIPNGKMPLGAIFIPNGWTECNKKTSAEWLCLPG